MAVDLQWWSRAVLLGYRLQCCSAAVILELQCYGARVFAVVFWRLQCYSAAGTGATGLQAMELGAMVLWCYGAGLYTVLLVTGATGLGLRLAHGATVLQCCRCWAQPSD
jgi:hypothetical protein